MVREPLDLLHRGRERLIGVYLVETPEGLALFDCGPRTCADELERALAGRGVDPDDVRHLLLSHIHLDHAGGAGTLVRRHPRVTVHVSELGAPHVVDPSRLIASARRLYGDELDTLFGEPEPVPRENVRIAAAPAVAGLACFPAPGHASHHVCYLTDEGVLLAGDAAGVRILPGRHVLPHAPPPDADVAAWERTLDEIERRRPEAIALIHFGLATDVDDHLQRQRATLRRWWERIEREPAGEDWIAAARADLVADDGLEAARHTELAAPLEQSFAGLSRHARKLRDAS